MIAADLGRAALVGSIPLVAVAGALRMEQLYAVAFLAGILTMFFDVAYQSYLPSLVAEEELIEGNSKLTASASVAEFGAFSLSGWLVQLITGPGAILVDAVSFLFSAFFVRQIRTPEPAQAPVSERRSVRVEVMEGLRAVMADPALRVLAVTWISLSMAQGLVGAVFLLFASRDLGFSPGVLGVIFGVGGVSSLLGALAAGRLAERLGIGRAMALGMLLGSAGVFITAAAPHASLIAVVFLVVPQCVSDPGWTIYEIHQMSLRQAIAPPALLGRINSAIRFAGLIATLLGALAGGGIASATGTRVVIVLGGCVMLSGAIALMLSPVRRRQGIGAPGVEPAAVV
jgi:Na+/melibiose symporter-like transporter